MVYLSYAQLIRVPQLDKRDTQEGQSILELALLLPLLLLIVAGALDLGRAFHVYITVTNAAREGARYGALYPTDTSGILNHARQEASGAGLTLCDPMASPPSPCEIEFPDDAQTGPGYPIRMTVQYEFQPILGQIFGGHSMMLSASATMIQF